MCVYEAAYPVGYAAVRSGAVVVNRGPRLPEGRDWRPGSSPERQNSTGDRGRDQVRSESEVGNYYLGKEVAQGVT
ncbi:hypothetical protein FTUN_1574 [Frigoriglobus tundricola]|uniref:Uncharacterized protein n=1 Tax=Frigoriglobus tundricola TaxID=2774151 RepID=A0A6M5YJB0_9BACT|nr:hypothetical protein FTUN_1574 [Frigoriglobus tundricola]